MKPPPAKPVRGPNAEVQCKMKPSHLPRYTLPFMALVTCLAAPASGRQLNVEQGPEGSGAGVTAVVVKAKPGDSLDKLIAAQYKNSPLRVDILRGAVLAANPILAGTAVRLKAGQEVVLPAHKDIVVAVLGALIPAAAPAAPAETRQAPEPMQRRDWIRYP